MKNLLPLFLLLTTFSLAQNPKHLRASLNLITKLKTPHPNTPFSLNTSSFSQHYIGISGTSSLIVSGRSKYEGGYPLDGHFAYLQLLPQKLLIQDSVEAKMNGFNIELTLAGRDLIKNTHFDLIPSISINTGRVWLKGNEAIKQKNPYFAPSLNLSARVVFYKFALLCQFGYDYDITKKHWKRKGFSKAPLLSIDEFKQHGLHFSFGLGYVFN